MIYTSMVVVLALLEYSVFGAAVGSARQKHGVKAPATTGDPVFERYFRVHYNTMEQLVVFVPGMFLFGFYVGDMWAAGVGVVFIIGRALYFTSYVKDPDKRGPGALLAFLSNAVLLFGTLIACVIALL